MLNKLSFQNYKAFTKGEVKIRPITILLGANSVGKSSVMQLFLMLQQTSLSEGTYKSALKLHGGFVSLGEGLNLIRKKDQSKVLSISFDFYSGRIFQELREEFYTTFFQEFFYFASIVQRLFGKRNQHESKNILQKLKAVFNSEEDIDLRFLRMSKKDLSDKIDRETFYQLVESTHQLIRKVNLKELPKEFQNDYLFYSVRGLRTHSNINHFTLLKERKHEYLLTFDFLENISKDVQKGHFEVKYDVVINDKALVIKSFCLRNEENDIVRVCFDQQSPDFKLNTLESKYINREHLDDRIFTEVKDIFTNPRTIFSFINPIENQKEEGSSVFANTLKHILNSVINVSSGYFTNDSINYVSPLRAHPKRYYFLDKAKINAYVDTLDGDAIAETLKENSQLRHQVNSWLEKFNLKVEVSQLQDIIHKLVINQNSLSLDITDVGFGISQVLPVIIQGFLSHEGSLTLIEQPEIHLHPKMQAELADLFIDIVASKNKKNKPSKYLFIETHSEYLLKRLRRRISDGTIAAHNVAIYLIDPQQHEEGAVIRELVVEDRGKFEWPQDFYGGELLKDTTEFLKNQPSVS